MKEVFSAESLDTLPSCGLALRLEARFPPIPASRSPKIEASDSVKIQMHHAAQDPCPHQTATAPCPRSSLAAAAPAAPARPVQLPNHVRAAAAAAAASPLPPPPGAANGRCSESASVGVFLSGRTRHAGPAVIMGHPMVWSAERSPGIVPSSPAFTPLRPGPRAASGAIQAIRWPGRAPREVNPFRVSRWPRFFGPGLELQMGPSTPSDGLIAREAR